MFARHFEVAEFESGHANRARLELPLSGAVTVTTAHYEIEWHGTKAEADEAGRVLEAAWPLYKEFFGAEPKLKGDERLSLRMYADAAAWGAALTKDGSAVPTGAGGMYWPPTKAAYLHLQPTVWYTRTLMLHEALHQFHYLAKTNNQNINHYWYVEGLAEHLSRHTWDGKTLRIARTPILSLESFHSKAMEDVSKTDFNLGKLVDGDYQAGRPESMALVQWLLSSGDDRKKRFVMMRDTVDRGGSAGQAFRSNIGDPAKLQKEFVAFVAANQEPMVPVWNQWDNHGDASVIGISPDVWSGSRTSKPSTWFEATVIGRRKEDGEWQAGLLLSYVDGKDYAVGTIRADGSLYAARQKDGAWHALQTTSQPGNPKDPLKRVMRAERKDGKVAWTVDGKLVGEFELPEGHMGLSVFKSTVTFESIGFDGFPKPELKDGKKKPAKDGAKKPAKEPAKDPAK